MGEAEHRGPRPHSVPVSETAAVVLDAAGTVLARSRAAETLLDCSPGRICERLLGLLPRAGTDAEPVGHPVSVPPVPLVPPVPGGDHAGPVAAGQGAEVPLVCTVVRLAARTAGDGAAPQWLVLVTPAETSVEAAERDASRRRTGLSQGAAAGIGASLDVTEMAETLVNLLVPDFADLATVDIAEQVLAGDEPPHLDTSGDVRLRRTAAAQSPEISAEDLLAVGEALPPVTDSTLMRPLMKGLPVLVPDVAVLHAQLGLDPQTLQS